MYWLHASESWTIPKGEFWYFIGFAQTCSIVSRSFEESYLLQSCIKLWIIPKGKFWYFKWFWMWILHLYFPILWENEESYLLPTCIWTIVSNARYALTILYDLWRIISIAIMHTNLKYCQRQVLVFSNDFVFNFSISLFRFVGRMKNHIHCLHASKTWIHPKATFGNSIVLNALTGSILWVLWIIISIAIMDLSYLQRNLKKHL